MNKKAKKSKRVYQGIALIVIIVSAVNFINSAINYRALTKKSDPLAFINDIKFNDDNFELREHLYFPLGWSKVKQAVEDAGDDIFKVTLAIERTDYTDSTVDYEYLESIYNKLDLDDKVSYLKTAVSFDCFYDKEKQDDLTAMRSFIKKLMIKDIEILNATSSSISGMLQRKDIHLGVFFSYLEFLLHKKRELSGRTEYKNRLLELYNGDEAEFMTFIKMYKLQLDVADTDAERQKRASYMKFWLEDK